jgi:hypothetical protein
MLLLSQLCLPGVVLLLLLLPLLPLLLLLLLPLLTSVPWLLPWLELL